jgi:alkylhydroperoxidase/carboxymuconolactone decarboxylase family protein YurZ
MADAQLLDAYVSLESLLDQTAELGDLIALALAGRARFLETHARMAKAAGAHFDRLAEIIRH